MGTNMRVQRTVTEPSTFLIFTWGGAVMGNFLFLLYFIFTFFMTGKVAEVPWGYLLLPCAIMGVITFPLVFKIGWLNMVVSAKGVEQEPQPEPEPPIMVIAVPTGKEGLQGPPKAFTIVRDPDGRVRYKISDELFAVAARASGETLAQA